LLSGLVTSPSPSPAPADLPKHRYTGVSPTRHFGSWPPLSRTSRTKARCVLLPHSFFLYVFFSDGVCILVESHAPIQVDDPFALDTLEDPHTKMMDSRTLDFVGGRQLFRCLDPCSLFSKHHIMTLWYQVEVCLVASLSSGEASDPFCVVFQVCSFLPHIHHRNPCNSPPAQTRPNLVMFRCRWRDVQPASKTARALPSSPEGTVHTGLSSTPPTQRLMETLTKS